MRYDVSDKYESPGKGEIQQEIHLEVLKSVTKGDSGPFPVKKAVAAWGLVFIILYSVFFVFLVNYQSKLKIPSAPGDILYTKYTIYIPLGSALVITITSLVIISLFKYKSLRKPQE